MVGLKCRDRLSYLLQPLWFPFTRLKSSQISRLGILNGFASSTGFPPNRCSLKTFIRHGITNV
jgi:hypothetical protein